ncbi:DNA/RNA helicase domain-containing protein [Streptomyces sp. NPDC059525]|uniref:DNA/RNA helicase domain-containing protein n=1 Tax=Streptomyces sp. NPDC059525 TaxID=3346857 RepID=UPI0036A145A2
MAAGTVAELAGALREDPAFFAECIRRYTAAGFGTPDTSEQRSWRNSWPPLFAALERAGLGGLRLYLEYGTPGAARRIDALLLGQRADGVLVVVLVELKQWAGSVPVSAGMVRRSDGEVVVHPVAQIASYRAFFDDWRPAGAPSLEIRARVVLHNASEEDVRALGPSSAGGGPVPVLGREDLQADGEALAGLLGCADMSPAEDGLVRSFEGIEWTPSAGLQQRIAQSLFGKSSFALVGSQQHAYVEVRDRVAALAADPGGPGTVITVQGGPGSGKTLIAIRLLAHLQHAYPGAAPRLATPSGTLRAHLLDATAAHPGGKELFPSTHTLDSAAGRARVVILDEAQRLAHDRHSPAATLERLIARVPIVVVFLDERQVIRPGEGFTVEDIRRIAHRHGRRHRAHELRESFRCRGSKAYTDWVDALLYGTPAPWSGPEGYDLDTAPDPFALQQWIDTSTRNGILARTAAGFCWTWDRTVRKNGILKPEVRIEHRDPATGTNRLWQAAWNAATRVITPDGVVTAPASRLWASHRGGHQQIGCVYTAQGLEYQHAGVIIGDDLTWEDDRWVAHPERSHDSTLKHLPPEEYLRYALNTYRVLLTRGASATRIYHTHAPSRHMLNRLVGPRTTAAGSPARHPV